MPYLSSYLTTYLIKAHVPSFVTPLCLHPKLLPGLIELDAPRLVYVSCNPNSAVRDLYGLQMGGYELSRVRPVDLFPHTPHLECVFTLNKKA